MTVKGKNIYVGLSGGVDSAVSAALLKKAGAVVTGVFIKGWYPPGLSCTWAAERRDAMRVAARLHIPFLTLDAGADYKRGVIEYLISEYRAGRTPNPDVMCNREVKFGSFYRFAKERGADLIATGHYAQGGYEKEGVLLRGMDVAKDQSYFLWAVPKTVLAQTLFPVGGMPKDEVRVLAQKYNLPVAAKKDSQGICFLGSISVEDFLRTEFGEAPGRAVDEKGTEVGRHNGVLLHTLGERIVLEGGASGPWFVHAKDINTNELVVSANRSPSSFSPEGFHLQEANWFQDPRETRESQTRYHGPLIKGMMQGERFIPAHALIEITAPGQSIVLYDGTRVIGGGIIK